jgi:hypothetical protein
MRKALPWMFFLALAAETGDLYWGRMWTPMRLMGWFIETLPIKASPFEIVCLVILFTSAAKGRARCATPMIRAIHTSLASLALCWVYGIARGGEVKPTYTQAHTWVTCLLFALTFSRADLRHADFHRLGKALFYAASYRALMAIAFYMIFSSDLPKNPAVLTSHADTVLFCAGLLLAVSHAIEVRTRTATLTLILSAPIILLAILLNNRRVAWASLAAGLLVLYLLLPKDRGVTRKVNRLLLVVAPLLALYVAAGWGHTKGVFAPLAALSSMGAGARDSSTRARDNENLGMVLMVKERPLLGTGFGHQWLELDGTLTVSVLVFPMYHYLPHNCVLALLAFTGSVGFAGIWMVLPVSVYLNRRTYLRASHPVDRIRAAMGIVVVVVVMNQIYGDMGMIMLTPMVILGAALGAASRLSPHSGEVAVARARVGRGEGDAE